MKIIEGIGLFIICLLASITMNTLVHEMVHVVQLSVDEQVEPVSLCIDYGQESAAHVGFRWRSDGDREEWDKNNFSREIIAYMTGFVAFVFFLYMLKVKGYW